MERFWTILILGDYLQESSRIYSNEVKQKSNSMLVDKDRWMDFMNN